MNDADRKAAERALEGKVGACPSCRARRWRVIELVAMFPYSDQGVTLGAPVVPLVLVGCVRCAAVRQFSAVQLGLVEPVSEKEPST
jgi:hypothetical protein